MPSVVESGPPGVSRPLSLRGVRVVVSHADEVVVKRGLAEVRLSLPGVAGLVGRLAHLADGSRDDDAVIAEFEADTQPDVRRMVNGLRNRGIAHDGSAADPAEQFWLSMAAYAPDARHRLSTVSVAVVGHGEIAEVVTSALTTAGVGTVSTFTDPPDHGSFDLWCIAGEGTVDEFLVDCGRAALAVGALSLPVWLDELVIRVGPMTNPYETACVQCYLLRADASDPERELHRLLRGQASDPAGSAGFLPAMPALAGQLAAMEIIKQLAGLPVSTLGHAIELTVVPYRSSLRRVLRVPRCPLCSGVAQQGAPVVARGSQLAQ